MIIFRVCLRLMFDFYLEVLDSNIWTYEHQAVKACKKKHKPGVMDNCIKPILNLTNDLSVLMSVNVSILKILLSHFIRFLGRNFHS